MSTNPHRLFIAIELPAQVRHAIRQHIDLLRRELPDVRASWTREENLHLTLKFLGDTPVEKIESLSQAVRHAATRVTPFEIEIAGCGAFPTKAQPRVLWIGVSATEPSPLQTLFKSLEDECAAAGFPRDERPFHPHLTIARLRQPHGARDLANLHKEIGFDRLSVRAEEVCLIRSELSSQGSRYTVIDRHGFV
ncbi:MAG TPA: RNA 2',3'-cyclic phosphodiesterase [Pyrinomonadaceae bacterium]|nr:RNA 2',3'-cyclic phosphodiesterase [Pyrinomonadaceae bacterium]